MRINYAISFLWFVPERRQRSGVYVNGKWAAESVKNGQNNIDFRVSANEYFLIGDNLADSLDSRSFGCVGRSAIRGILIKKLF